MDATSKDCPSCGLTHPSSADTCECGYTWSLGAPKLGSSQTETQYDRDYRFFMRFLAGGALLSLLVITASFVRHTRNDSQKTDPDKHNPVSAFSECKEAIRHRVNTPATLDFQSMLGGATSEEDSNGQFVAKFWFDYANEHGAKVRKNCTCTVSPVGTDQYSVKNLNITDWGSANPW